MNKAIYDLEYLKKLGKSFGGDCLSENYTQLSDKYLWICSEGHKWEANAQNVKSLRRWCPVCGKNRSALNRRKFSLQDMQEVAMKNEGKCLSNEYHGIDKYYKWECKEGHTWSATFHKVKNGKNWCPTCAIINRAKKRIKYSIEDLKKFALNKDGFCLSESFINIKSKYLWQCKNGHKWFATGDNILNNQRWCPECANNFIGNIEEMNKIAFQRGGRCLSNKYINSKTKIIWECSEKHVWDAIPSLIKRGAWCPECGQGLGERICREFFEQLLETSFNKSRPNWLKTDKGHKMELDGYSKSLKIAFEHQGLQHYKNIKHFHSDNPKKLTQTIKRDNLKLDLCTERGITLIQVPSILDKLGIENVKEFIKQELIKKNVKLPSDFDKIEIDLSTVYSPEKLQELREIAELKGGRLLSTHYLGIFEPLEWECKKGHRWESSANSVKNSNTWCPYCIGRHQTIDDMQTLASKHGGLCLSKKYVNNDTHLSWQCKLGHQFQAKPANVTSGHWCPDCGNEKVASKKRKYNLDEIKKYAISKKGKCLSQEYKSYKKKLKWQCGKGHEWEATPDSVIKNNIWCKICKTK